MKSKSRSKEKLEKDLKSKNLKHKQTFIKPVVETIDLMEATVKTRNSSKSKYNSNINASTNSSSQNLQIKEELAKYNLTFSIRDRYKSGLYESIISKYKLRDSSHNGNPERSKSKTKYIKLHLRSNSKSSDQGNLHNFQSMHDLHSHHSQNSGNFNLRIEKEKFKKKQNAHSKSLLKLDMASKLKYASRAINKISELKSKRKVKPVPKITSVPRALSTLNLNCKSF